MVLHRSSECDPLFRRLLQYQAQKELTRAQQMSYIFRIVVHGPANGEIAGISSHHLDVELLIDGYIGIIPGRLIGLCKQLPDL